MDPIWPGLREALNIAVAIARLDLNPSMFVTHSPDGEYTSCYYIKAEKVVPDGR